MHARNAVTLDGMYTWWNIFENTLIKVRELYARIICTLRKDINIVVLLFYETTSKSHVRQLYKHQRPRFTRKLQSFALQIRKPIISSRRKTPTRYTYCLLKSPYKSARDAIICSRFTSHVHCMAYSIGMIATYLPQRSKH